MPQAKAWCRAVLFAGASCCSAVSCTAAIGPQAACLLFRQQRPYRALSFVIEAAIQAIETSTVQACEKRRHVERGLEQALYEGGHARRHYDAVDPDNRLMAGETGATPECRARSRPRASGRA